MKRYLIKIFEKLQENANSLHTESPDPLAEHSNSVQESHLKINNQSSLSDINNGAAMSRNGNPEDNNKGSSGTSNGRNHGKAAKFSKSQTTNAGNIANMKQAKQKYENTENYIKEESSEENQFITEDEDDYNINKGDNENRKRKLKKPPINMSQLSPGKSMYAQNMNTAIQLANTRIVGATDQSRSNNQFRNQQENSYNDIEVADRTAVNRTPLLEHYQNQSSLTRGQTNQSYAANQSTSVPRPTIASELKLLKESRGSPALNDISQYQQQQQSFMQGNSLASFMWNKEGRGAQCEGLDQNTSNRGSRVRKEYNIHDGTTAIRPLTRNNQRRPVSRQVAAVDNSGMSVQKMLVQQQMRNTHFGDGGFGFQAKFKADLSLDSERKVSRKRGTKVASKLTAQDCDQSLRESQQQHTLQSMINNQGIISGGGNAALLQNSTLIYIYRLLTNKLAHKRVVGNVGGQLIAITEGAQGNNTVIGEGVIQKNREKIIMVQQQQQQKMAGTSYENNVFKMISRTNSNRQQQFQVQNPNHKKQSIIKDQSTSPPLKPIEEIVHKPTTLTTNSKIVIGASSTQSKFYVQNTSHNTKVSKKSRNADLQQRNSGCSDAPQVSNNQNLKSYNITQEKFFPSKSQNTQHQQQTTAIDNKMQTFYNSKHIKSECMMSLEFINSSQQQQNQGVQGNINSNMRMKKGSDNMIREEQYEEISEDESPYKKELGGTINKRQRNQNAYDDNRYLDENYSQESFSQQNPTAIIDRPTNRLGCSRAFHQTKENWKDNQYSTGGGGAHSLPRNQQHFQNLQDNDQQSCKTTSSAASLTMCKQNVLGQQNNGGGGVNSISPKPYKWNNGKDSLIQQNTTQKIQEMQKEVNLMYLGSIANPKKKAGAGIKLNPINRGTGGSNADQSYQL